MKSNRRKFLRNSLTAAGTLALSSMFKTTYGSEAEKALDRVSLLPPEKAATDEDFWYWVQRSFTSSSNMMNLNNGGVCPQPKIVQDAFEKYNRICNEGPAYYMWHVFGDGRESVRKSLAKLAGCSSEEIAIQRNTTEALETVIFGLDLEKGDEVVLTKQDYPNMINA